MNGAQTIARAGLIVSGAFLVSRVLGFVRVVVIGNAFGAGPELDAFFAAFRLPDLIFQLVAAGALSSALIPIVSALFTTNETARAWRVVSTVINLMLIGAGRPRPSSCSSWRRASSRPSRPGSTSRSSPARSS